MKEWSVARGLRVEACLHEVLFRDRGIAGVAEKYEHVTAVVDDIAPCIAPRLAASTAWAGLGDVVYGTVHRDRHDRRRRPAGLLDRVGRRSSKVMPALHQCHRRDWA